MTTVVNWFLGITSGVLGIIAIWLSLYFYRRGNELYQKLFDFLSRIEATATRVEALSHEMEEASKRVTGRLLDGVLGQLPSPARIEKAEEGTVLRIAEKVKAVLGPQHSEEALAIQRGVQEEVSKAFTAVRAQVAPSSVDYDWGPFVRKMDELEASHRFIGVSFVRNTLFSSDPAIQEALQYALRNGILEQYFVDNLPGKANKVRACKLNRVNELVIRALTKT